MRRHVPCQSTLPPEPATAVEQPGTVVAAVAERLAPAAALGPVSWPPHVARCSSRARRAEFDAGPVLAASGLVPVVSAPALISVGRAASAANPVPLSAVPVGL